MAKRKPTPQQIDPSRTSGIRKRFVAEARRRFKALGRAIHQLVYVEDAFGRRGKKNPFTGGTTPKRVVTLNTRFAFITDDQKVREFQRWLRQQIDAGILGADDEDGTIPESGNAWDAKYIDSAYRQGTLRSYLDSRAADLAKPAGFFEGSKAEFLRQAFNAPERLSKIKLLKIRSYEQLQGVTANMSSAMSRVLAQGLADGKHPGDIAADLRRQLGFSMNRAETIARTETIHAHAEGQLDAFEDLEIEEIGVLAEWQTAGDDRVCPQCDALNGLLMTPKEARGLIPRHPNCRCAWVPSVLSKLPPDARRRKANQRKMNASLLAGGAGGDSLKKAKAKSTWAGADV